MTHQFRPRKQDGRRGRGGGRSREGLPKTDLPSDLEQLPAIDFNHFDQMTPAEAKAEIEKLKLDKDFGAALRGGAMHPSSKSAKQKWSELHRIAYGDDPVR